MFKKKTVALISTFVLAACGGSGGEKNSSTPTPINKTETVNTKHFPRVETEVTNVYSQNEFTVDNLLAPPKYLAKDVNQIGAKQIYISDLEVNIGGKSYKKGAVFDLSDLGFGLNELSVSLKKGITVKHNGETVTGDSDEDKMMVYKQNNSSIIYMKPNDSEVGRVLGFAGNATPKQNIPIKGIFTYQGDAFGYDRGNPTRGSFVYIVNFDENKGGGAIKTENLNIKLDLAPISEIRSLGSGHSVIGISGLALEVDSDGTKALFGGKGKYELGFFGNNGKEIVGHTVGLSPSYTGDYIYHKWQIGFAGKQSK